MLDQNPALEAVDSQIAAVLRGELARQRDTLEMIASENFASPAVLEAMGTVLTNKYAEGYPGKRYYGGCEFIDAVEQLALDLARRAPHARLAGELLRPLLPLRALRGAPRDGADRSRPRSRPGARAPASPDPDRRQRLLAQHRLRGVRRDRARGRGGALRRHRPHRGARGGGRAPHTPRPGPTPYP